jgi:hypothetical protein
MQCAPSPLLQMHMVPFHTLDSGLEVHV